VAHQAADLDATRRLLWPTMHNARTWP